MHKQKSVEGSGGIIQDQISSELNSQQNSGRASFEDLISHCKKQSLFDFKMEELIFG